MAPESKPRKPYRTYRGGRAGGIDDADAARFDFTGRSAAAAAPARAPTPEGLPAPDMRPSREPLPGRRVAEPPPPGGPAGPRRGFFRRRWRRILAIGIPVLFLLFAFWLYLGYRAFSDEVAKANKRIDKRTRAALTPTGNILRNPQISLVMGSDSRGQSATAGARADSILLVRTDPSHHLISMLSIPRDLYVPIPGHGTNKINAAFAFGGPPLLIRTVNRLTSLKVNHVVLVDFAGFRKLIDDLGGITIVNPTKIVSSENFDGHGWQFGLDMVGNAMTLGEQDVVDYLRSREAEVAERLGKVRSRMVGSVASTTTFPNFSFLPGHNAFRTWIPKGPHNTEIHTWVLVNKNIPFELKEKYRKGVMRTFSPSGTLEMDDGENWEHATLSNAGVVTRRQNLHYGLGLNSKTENPDFKGELHLRKYNDANQRAFYRRWLQMMTRPTA